MELLPKEVLVRILHPTIECGTPEPNDLVYIFFTAYETIFFPLAVLKQYFLLCGVCRKFREVLTSHLYCWYILKKPSFDDIIFIVNLPGADNTENWGSFTGEICPYQQPNIGHTLSLKYPSWVRQP